MNQNSSSTIAILIPDIAKLGDEDMRRIARHRDGRWSDQTKNLLSKFETIKLDLNRGWAATWAGWSCPCCKRSKPQIARLTSRGVLLCHLENHHDHLDDFLKHQFLKITVASDETERRIQINRAETALRPLVERFERTLICMDCNLADGRVKLELRGQIETHFTFTPSEIFEFITVRDNQHHEINFGRAHSIWDEASEDFKDRVDFTERMAARIEKGHHTREVSPGQKLIGQLRTKDICFQLCAEQMPDVHSLHLGELIEARSIARDGVGGAKRPPNKQRGQAPSDAEFASVNAEQTSKNKQWRDAGETWKCPCCERTKRDICRRSNRGEWVAKIQRFYGFELETDPEQLSWRRLNEAGDIVISAPKLALICHDCRGIVAQLRQRRADLDARILTLEDLRRLAAQSAKNIAHQIDFVHAEQIIIENSAFLDAIAEFEAHQRLATRTWVGYLKLTMAGLSNAKAREQIGYELAKVRDCDLDEGAGHADWLLYEATRLNDAESA